MILEKNWQKPVKTGFYHCPGKNRFLPAKCQPWVWDYPWCESIIVSFQSHFTCVSPRSQFATKSIPRLLPSFWSYWNIGSHPTLLFFSLWSLCFSSCSTFMCSSLRNLNDGSSMMASKSGSSFALNIREHLHSILLHLDTISYRSLPRIIWS